LHLNCHPTREVSLSSRVLRTNLGTSYVRVTYTRAVSHFAVVRVSLPLGEEKKKKKKKKKKKRKKEKEKEGEREREKEREREGEEGGESEKLVPEESPVRGL
jgi:hypothetical protein